MQYSACVYDICGLIVHLDTDKSDKMNMSVAVFMYVS